MRIRKIISLLMIIALVMSIGLYPAKAFTDSKDKIVITIGSSNMYVNGVKKQLDPGKTTALQVIGNSIYVPPSALVKEMGGSVTWIAKEKRLDIVLGNKTIKMWIDKKDAMVDGKKTIMVAPPKLINGNPLVPVQFLVDKLGATLTLDKTKKVITIEFIKHMEKVSEDDWNYLLINDYEIKKEDLVIKEKAKESYVFINAEIFKYAFKYPYLTSNYPDFYREDNTFTATWSDNNEVLVEVIMELDNPTFKVNGQSIDAGFGPIKNGDAYYIPINLFVAALDMDFAYEEDARAIILQYKEAFSKEILVGYWSDIDTDLFTEFKDPSTGAKSLASFANAYIYNEDGTYRLRMLAVGGFTDTFIEQSGKYKILGNTIMHYDISETLYKGTPFVLQYKNKLLDKPQYSFIDNYYPDENKIVFDQIPVTKKR